MQKKTLILPLLILIPWLCLGQSPYVQGTKASFISTEPNTAPASATDLYTTQRQLLALLPLSFQKHTKPSENTFREIFEWAQKHLFKHFEAYTPIEALVEKGTYNCVSGTLFYALLLDYYQVPFVIHETLDHAYLIAYFGKQKRPVLIESTLKEQGWIAGKTAVEQQEVYYLKQSKSSFKTSIKSYELAALQLYNLAVVAYNQKAYHQAQYYLRQNYILYPSARAEQLYRMVLAKTQASPMQAIAQGKTATTIP